MVTNYDHLTFLEFCTTFRTTFLEIRLHFVVVSIVFEGRQIPMRPQPAQLRPASVRADGSDPRIRNKNLRPSGEGRRKASIMTLNFDHYRAAARAAGDHRHYTDAEILRLWGFVDYLATRAIKQACPHLIAQDPAANTAICDTFALYSKEPQKEAKT